jgi:hypothetical protein
MKKPSTLVSTLSLLLFAVVALGFSSSASAFGNSRSTGTGTGTGGISTIIDGIQLNPYIMALQKEFDNAVKPTEQKGNQTIISSLIQMNKRYECRTFFALSKTDVAAPMEGRTWYQFTRFGQLFIDNQSYMETGRVKTFAPNVMMENELWGQSLERNYYEALRINAHGDLIVQSFSEQQLWARMLMNWLGIDELVNSWLAKFKGMALPTSVFGATGFVVSVSYCPNPSAPVPFLDYGTEEDFIQYIQSR